MKPSSRTHRGDFAMERYQFIPSGGEAMLTAYHPPLGGASPRGCAVLVAPVHEEKKAVHRPLVDLARALSARGYAALRFDPRSTGDSQGAADGLTLATLRQDLEVAIGLAQDLSGAETVSLVGVRLGADLAAVVGLTSTRVEKAVLCVPVIAGDRYLREVRIRGRIRGALTVADGGEDVAGSETGLDYGGHYVSPQLIADLEAHSLMTDATPLAGRVVCIDVRGRDSMGAPLTALVERLRQRGATVEATVVLDHPFWNALGPVVPHAFIRAVTETIADGGN